MSESKTTKTAAKKAVKKVAKKTAGKKSAKKKVAKKVAEQEGAFMNVAVETVVVVYNPRKKFDAKAMQKLVASVKAHGVMQPIAIRLDESGQRLLVAGERRLRAAKKAGLETVPAVMLNVNEREARELALVENLEREDLDVLEEAEAFHELMDWGYSVVELAERFGYTREYINSRVMLLRLDKDVKEAVVDGEITLKTARALGRVEDEEKRGAALKKIVEPEYQSVPLTQDSALNLVKRDFIGPQDDAKKWNGMQAKLEKEHPGVEFVKYEEKPKGLVWLEEMIGWEEAEDYGTKWMKLAKKYKVPMFMRCGYECKVDLWAKKSLMKTADAGAKKGWLLKRKAKDLTADEKLEKEREQLAAEQAAAHKVEMRADFLKRFYTHVAKGKITKDECMVLVRDYWRNLLGPLEIILGVDFGAGWEVRSSDGTRDQALEMVEILLEDAPGPSLLGLMMLVDLDSDLSELVECSEVKDEKFACLVEDREEGE